MRNQFLLGLCMIAVVTCSGCQMKKTGEVSLEDGQAVDVIKVEQRIKPDFKAAAEMLLDMDWEECEKKGGTLATEKAASVNDNGIVDCTVERLDYIDSENELAIVTALDDPYCTAHIVDYRYKKDHAGFAYENTFFGSQEEPSILNRLRAKYPLEEIDTCTKEEAIKKCEGLAKALGYENSTVNVYAMTEEALNMNYDDTDGAGYGRPSEEYLEDDDQERWTKEDEAMYLLYQPTMAQVEVTGPSLLHDLYVVYSPRYERIVRVSGVIPFQEGAVVGRESIVSEETAKKGVMLEKGITKEEDIVMDDIKFTYVIVPRETFSKESHTLVPAWRVDYHLLNSAQYAGVKAYMTTFIDATTGEPCKFYTEE